MYEVDRCQDGENSADEKVNEQCLSELGLNMKFRSGGFERLLYIPVSRRVLCSGALFVQTESISGTKKVQATIVVT